MATTPPASTPDATSPDGAKPGAVTKGPGDRYAYDADGRAGAREAAPITIGEKTFYRRRKNWAVVRSLRTLLRGQERAATRSLRLRARISALVQEIRGVQDFESGAWTREPITDDTQIADIESQIDTLEGELDQAQDESDELAFQIVALLLVDDEHVALLKDVSERELEAPRTATAIAHLKDSLDVAEGGELASMLSTGSEPVEDPTPTTTSSD